MAIISPTCAGLYAILQALEQQLRALQNELRSAPPGERGDIAEQIRDLSPRVASARTAYSDCLALHPQPDLRRPFYVIGHNTNSLSDALQRVQDGANALEPDVQVYADNAGRLCISHDPGGPEAPELEVFLDGLHSIAVQAHALALIVFDCKRPAATPEHGETLVNAIRSHLTYDLADLTVIISISNRAQGQELLFGRIVGQLRPFEGLMIDAEDDPESVSAYFGSRGVMNFGYGNGISVLNPVLGGRYRPTLERACARRAQTGVPKFIEAWTVNGDDDLREYIRIGVDGIITDNPAGLSAIAREAGSGVRLATRGDNPFQPMGAEYGLSIRTGDRMSAGTDSQVTITISGEGGICRTVVNSYLDGRFEANSWTFVTIPSADLGPLHTLSIQSDDSGNAPDWYLEKVEIASRRYQQSGVATFNRWIATTEPCTVPIT